MADKVDLAAAFKMEPKDAIAYFRSKGFQVSDRWQEVWQEAHTKAFTVAKAMRMDVLETIRKEVDDALAQGVTFAEFEKRLTPKLQAQGWWGKHIWVDGNGTARNIQLGSPWRLKTIYRTNLQTAYMAGRYRRQLATSKTHPYWMYVAVMDGATRKEHAVLNGRVFRFDDPIWQYLYPPNGWGCRCRVRALSVRQVERMGLTIEDGSGYIETFEADAGFDERTGEIYRVDHMRVNVPKKVSDPEGGTNTMSPDLGWAYNVGSATYGTDISIAQKLGRVKSQDLRSQLIQALNNSPLRHQQFAGWAESVLTHRRPGHSVQVLGFMPEAVALAVANKLDSMPSRLMVVNEKQLAHSDSDKHRELGTALTLEQLKELPAMLNNPEAVLHESSTNDLLLVYPNGDGRKVKIVLRVNHKLKKQTQKLDAVINAFLVESNVLKNEGVYQVISGKI